MTFKNISFAFALATMAMLSACGGGGSSDSSAASPVVQTAATSAQGVYEGTTSSGFVLNTLVLEDDQYWTIYGTQSGATMSLNGLVQGTGKSNNGSFSSSDLKDFFFTGEVTAGSLSATYVPGVSFSGTSSSSTGTQALSFTTKAMSPTLYNYNTAPILADIAGAWTMNELSGALVNINIAANGAFTGTSSGCSFSGTLTPRPSGKNVFNVAINFGGAPCRLSNQAASGVAVDYLLSTGKRQLLLAGVNGPRTAGTVVFGTR